MKYSYIWINIYSESWHFITSIHCLSKLITLEGGEFACGIQGSPLKNQAMLFLFSPWRFLEMLPKVWFRRTINGLTATVNSGLRHNIWKWIPFHFSSSIVFRSFGLIYCLFHTQLRKSFVDWNFIETHFLQRLP